MRFTSVSSLAQTLVNGAFTTMVSVITAIAYVFQLGSFAPSLILPVIIILFVDTAFTVFMALYQKKVTEKQFEASSKESGVTYGIINGIQKIRLAGAEKRVFAKWAASYAKSAKLMYNPPLLIRISGAITLLISTLGSVAIFLVAAKTNIDAPDMRNFETNIPMGRNPISLEDKDKKYADKKNFCKINLIQNLHWLKRRIKGTPLMMKRKEK